MYFVYACAELSDFTHLRFHWLVFLLRLQCVHSFAYIGNRHRAANCFCWLMCVVIFNIFPFSHWRISNVVYVYNCAHNNKNNRFLSLSIFPFAFCELHFILVHGAAIRNLIQLLSKHSLSTALSAQCSLHTTHSTNYVYFVFDGHSTVQLMRWKKCLLATVLCRLSPFSW